MAAIDTDLASFQFTSMSETPSRASSRVISRRSSRAMTSSPVSSSPIEQDQDMQKKEEKFFMHDPKRFTPTLHANLVAEILSLRREVENKNGIVLGLEESLSTIKDENNELHTTVTEQAKESKSLKKQMEMLEGGTLAAIEDLAVERDKATDALSEVKKRLEVSQKKARSQEEAHDRTNILWERDKERWDSERRNYERKVHVVEGRLKTLLTEIEATQGKNPYHNADGPVESHERPYSRASRGSGARSVASRRRDSSNTNDGHDARNFRLSNIHEVHSTAEGTTLADELQFDDEESDYSDGGFPSPEALPEEQHLHRQRPYSALSHRASVKARKLLGLDVEEDDSQVHGTLDDLEASETEAGLAPSETDSSYVDGSTQFTPPLSPYLIAAHRLSTIEELESNRSFHELETLEEGTGQSDELGIPAEAEPKAVTAMVSSGCQTVEQPLSPPDTPIDHQKAAFPSSLLKVIETSTASTQTIADEPQPPVATRAGTTVPKIPFIAIHPPEGSHSPSGSVVLPPHTKNASCQVSITPPVRSISIQTEEIRIDQRPVKLPPHLLPSAISSKLSSPSIETQVAKLLEMKEVPERKAKLQIPPPIQPKSSRRYQAVEKKEDPFAEFESTSNLKDAVEDGGDGNVSDDSFAHKEPMKKTLSKVQNSWKLVPQPPETSSKSGDTGTVTIFQNGRFKESNEALVLSEPQSPTEPRKASGGSSKPIPKPINTGKQPDIRRAALISSGTQAHVQRSRSPSAPSLPSLDLLGEGTSTNAHGVPPFPVPTRSSSRQVPLNSSDGTGSPTPQTVSFFGAGQSREKQSRPPSKKPVLRKIRSATNTQRSAPVRNRSPPPPSPSVFTDVSQHPPPPLPMDDITSPYRQTFRPSVGSRQKSSAASAADESVASEQTTVVDAIAQTMIGEWMWKYVRRRKSFGLPESAAAEFESGRSGDPSGGGVRHQRWVWLAPYERAVMWSSKQPMSGAALMGKSGRKLTIQSVLDVRDDTPMPKGAVSSSCFGRSILILTPQRALKFTATTRERHHVWLSALSFLSHTSVLPTELGNFTTITADDTAPPPPPSRGGLRSATFQNDPVRRHAIRDSIRLAKGKGRNQSSKRSFTSPTNSSIRESEYAATHQYDDAAEDEDAAEPPLVPRTSGQTRKRSNTGPKSNRPSSSFRSYSSSAKPSTYSLQSRQESETSYGWMTDGGPTMSSRYGGVNQYTGGSDFHSPTQTIQGTQPNFFEAVGNVGTVRMEAFVRDEQGNYRNRKPNRPSNRNNGIVVIPGHPSVTSITGGYQTDGVVDRSSGVNAVGEKKERGSYRTRTGRKKDMRYWGAGSERLPDTTTQGHSGNNPFEGF